MREDPKRLEPKKGVLRELYLKSGNQCAFPDCTRLIINKVGLFVGELCHIEAVSPGGSRFNANQSNDERRSFDNLLLLCGEHHTIIDAKENEEEYSALVVKEMKSKHEQKFTDIAQKIQEGILDQTTLRRAVLPKTLKRFADVLEWGLSDEEINLSLQELTKFIYVLEGIPFQTRQLLEIMIKRSNKRKDKLYHDSHDLEVLLPEIFSVCQISFLKLLNHISILEKYKIACCFYDDYYTYEVRDIDPSTDSIPVLNFPLLTIDGWSFWSDLKRFSEMTNTSLSKIVIDLDFGALDS